MLNPGCLDPYWGAFGGYGSGSMKSFASRRMTRPRRGLAVLLLALLAPVIAGCPSEFSDQIATAIETAARGIANSALDLFFNQFQSNGTSTGG